MIEVGTDAVVFESVAVGEMVCGDPEETLLAGCTVLGGGVVVTTLELEL
jgi:hypothetical protein